MIAFLKGEIAELSPTHVLLNVNNVGYEVHISLQSYAYLQKAADKQCFIHTHMHVREDAHLLFGFTDLKEKELFLHLISVNGIGPNSARTILSYSTCDDLSQSIINGNVAQIQKIKGIGPKTAQRLILELKDKLVKSEILNTDKTLTLSNNIDHEALTALMVLGFAKPQVEKVIAKISGSNTANNLSVEDLIRQALKLL